MPHAQHHILCSTHVHLAHVQPHGVTHSFIRSFIHSSVSLTHARHAHAQRDAKHDTRVAQPSASNKWSSRPWRPSSSVFRRRPYVPVTCDALRTFSFFFLCRECHVTYYGSTRLRCFRLCCTTRSVLRSLTTRRCLRRIRAALSRSWRASLVSAWSPIRRPGVASSDASSS